ncbi:hypothetical protein [Mycobacterium pinniadriaticum]|uniref:Uncharacterized protein n=1 Tax=Mycobacterium pinniadriaticum TaxID=2994102 RepID=A0ABT3SNN9_9MYCO|nr:hypothetical protein [Mycobacterium pinniadriaticum]MCX2940465.1 hypothetical protein [Mycobacterium pinniadriaticum]
MAWRDTPQGPVITDLRVTSFDGTPITVSSLRKIVPDRLARAAAAKNEELKILEWSRDRIRKALEDEFGDELQARGVDLSHMEAMARSEPGAGGPRLIRRKRPRGQPKLTNQELQQIADWARAAAAESFDDGLAVHGKIAARAAAAEWRSYSKKHLPSSETVKGWIRRCKDAGLLAPDYTRKPRNTSSEDG